MACVCVCAKKKVYTCMRACMRAFEHPCVCAFVRVSMNTETRAPPRLKESSVTTAPPIEQLASHRQETAATSDDMRPWGRGWTRQLARNGRASRGLGNHSIARLRLSMSSSACSHPRSVPTQLSPVRKAMLMVRQATKLGAKAAGDTSDDINLKCDGTRRHPAASPMTPSDDKRSTEIRRLQMDDRNCLERHKCPSKKMSRGQNDKGCSNRMGNTNAESEANIRLTHPTAEAKPRM